MELVNGSEGGIRVQENGVMSSTFVVLPRGNSVREFPRRSTSGRLAISRAMRLPPRVSPELHDTVELALTALSHQRRRAIRTRFARQRFGIRMDECVLKRVIFALLQGVFEARAGSGGDIRSLLLTTRRCLNGYGAALELTDDGPPLSRKLLFDLSQMDSPPLREDSGWHLLIARDLAESHGGRLLVQSPPRGEKAGALLRLFLPLSVEQPEQREERAGNASAPEREAIHASL
jgi:nitrogen-specific signal transduction histidine kinase